VRIDSLSLADDASGTVVTLLLPEFVESSGEDPHEPNAGFMVNRSGV